jgi:hypothetical protein
MKEIYKYSKKYPDKYFYCDYETYAHLMFSYGYSNNEHIKLYYSVENLYGIEDAFVIINSTRGIIEYPFVKTEPHYLMQKPLSSWVLVKVISGPKISVYGDFDPEIYYIPENLVIS